MSKNDISDYLVKSGKEDKFSSRRNIIIKWGFSLAFIIMGVYSYIQNQEMMNLIALLAIGLACHLIFPILFKADLVIESKSQSKSNFKSLIDVPIKIRLREENVLISTDKHEEAVVHLSKLENIIENEQNIYVELRGTLPMIIPKSNEYDYVRFLNEIKTIANNLS